VVRRFGSMLAALVAFSPLARAEPITVLAFALPTRSDPGALGARARAIAEPLARRLRGRVVAAVPRSFAEPIKRARELLYAGSIDEAMVDLDRVLDAAERAPESISADETADVIAAHVLRATIAVARGEIARARSLLLRLLIWDPSFELLPGEKNPQIQAALADVRTVAAPPAIGPSALGQACQSGEVILVVRRGPGGRLEFARFDRDAVSCHVVADVSAVPDQDVTARLAEAPPARSATPSADRSGRRQEISGAVLLAAGAATAAVGIYFAVDAATRLSDIGRACTATRPCQEASVSNSDDAYRRSTIVGSVLVPIGVLALVSGSVLTRLGTRRRPRVALSAVVSSTGAIIQGGAAF
jgi:hypothetical protein